MARAKNGAASKADAAGWPFIADGLWPLVRPIGEFTPDPENAKVHKAKSIDGIKGSLTEFGQTKPIVVQAEGMIVRAGNGTLAAAIALGWTHLAAVVVKDWSAAKHKAYGLADNRTAELSEWDDERAMQLLGEINVASEELSAMFAAWPEEMGWLELPGDAEESDKPEETNPVPEDPAATFRVLITCRDDAHQREVLELCQRSEWKAKAF